MSKRLKAPRYKKLMAYLESIMLDPKETSKSRLAAAFRLDELYARLDTTDQKSIAYKRRLELKRLETPDPVQAPSTGETEPDKDAQIKGVFASVSNTRES